MNAPQPRQAGGEADGYNELLRDMAEHIGRRLQEVGLPQEQAFAIGETVIEDMADAHGGRLLYFPKNHSFRARRRWFQMWEEFNGNNHNELSKKYGMNIRQVYRVLAIVREEMRRRGGDLFGDQQVAGND